MFIFQTCLPEHWVCDGRAVCDNFRDEGEITCTHKYCQDTKRKRCANQPICLSPDAFCDGNRDCPDGHDESPNTCTARNCQNYNRTICPNGKRCIKEEFFCDGNRILGQFSINQCDGNADEDEEMCAKWCKEKNAKLLCPYGIHSAMCSNGSSCIIDPQEAATSNYIDSLWECIFTQSMWINIQNKCDGKSQCPLGEDEDESECKELSIPWAAMISFVLIALPFATVCWMIRKNAIASSIYCNVCSPPTKLKDYEWKRIKSFIVIAQNIIEGRIPIAASQFHQSYLNVHNNSSDVKFLICYMQ